MATVTGQYVGNLRTVNKHLQSGAEVLTDAPTDNHGKGEAFSPTDLVATALADCMMTLMAIKADGMGVDLSGTEFEVTKIMNAVPRRIAEVVIKFQLPANVPESSRGVLEKAAMACPVIKSLHEDVEKNVTFNWG